MAIYDPAALAVPQTTAYHLQSQTDYEDGDGASIRSLKKPRIRKENYKPTSLKWPFLVCHILFLLLCLSLVASALVLMPNSDTNAVILPPTSSTILERRQDVPEGDAPTSGAAEVGGPAGGESAGEVPTSSEEVVSVEKPTTTAVEVQPTVETTLKAEESAPTETPQSVATEESASGTGKKEEDIPVETEPEMEAEKMTSTTSSKHTEKVEPEITPVAEKPTESPTEQKLETTLSMEKPTEETTEQKPETTPSIEKPAEETTTQVEPGPTTIVENLTEKTTEQKPEQTTRIETEETTSVEKEETTSVEKEETTSVEKEETTSVKPEESTIPKTTRDKTARPETTSKSSVVDDDVPTKETTITSQSPGGDKSTTTTSEVREPTSSPISKSSDDESPTVAPDTTTTTSIRSSKKTEPTRIDNPNPNTTVVPESEPSVEDSVSIEPSPTQTSQQNPTEPTRTTKDAPEMEDTTIELPEETTKRTTATTYPSDTNPTTTTLLSSTTSVEISASTPSLTSPQGEPTTVVSPGEQPSFSEGPGQEIPVGETSTATASIESPVLTVPTVKEETKTEVPSRVETTSGTNIQTVEVPSGKETETPQVPTNQETQTSQDFGQPPNTKTGDAGGVVTTTSYATSKTEPTIVRPGTTDDEDPITVLPGTTSHGEPTTTSGEPTAVPGTTKKVEGTTVIITASNYGDVSEPANSSTKIVSGHEKAESGSATSETTEKTPHIEVETGDQNTADLEPISTRKTASNKGIDIVPITYTSTTAKETSKAESTEDDAEEETSSARILTNPAEVDTETTLAFSAVRTTIVTQPPPYAIVTDKEGELITKITTPSPLTYELTYTTQVEDTRPTDTSEASSKAKTEPGEWILVTTVIVARIGGTVTRVTETRSPFAMMTVIDEELVEITTTPPSEIHELTVGGTPYTYTSFYKSYRMALATGGSEGFDPARLSAIELTKADVFLGSLLPLMFAVGVSIIFRIIDINVKMYQPFAAMAKEDGASARNSVTLSFFEGIRSYLAPLTMAFGGYVAPLLTTLLVGASWIVVPLASEAISIKVYGECEEGSDEGCKCDLGVTPGFTYALLAIISIMVVVMLFVVFVLQRWKTGLASSPWSIAAMSILAMNPQFRAPLISMPRQAKTGVVPHGQLDKVFGDRKYKLGSYRTVDGDERHAIMPADDSAAGLTADMTPDPVSNGLAGLNGPVGERRHIPFVPLKLWSRFVALAVHGGMLGLVAYYQTVATPYKNKFEVFMDGPDTGKRFLFSGIGISMAFWWFYFFASVAAIMPYHLMFGTPQPPDRSILVDRPSNPFTGLVAAIRSRQIFLAIVCITSILSELLPVLLANIPFRHVGALGEDSVCSRLALAVLSLAVLVLFASLFVRWPHMPADPRTIAGATYYVAESTMIGLFEGFGEVGPKARDRRIRELGRRFGYGDCVSTSGRRRFGVDAAGGVLGELASSDGVIESAFSSMKSRIAGTVTSGSRSDGSGGIVRDPMSGALPSISTPSPMVPADDNDTVASRSPTGYLGGTVSGYGRFGPGYEYEPTSSHPGGAAAEEEEGDIGSQQQQRQPRGLLDEIQYQEESVPQQHQQQQLTVQFREARLSNMSGYMGRIEDRPAIPVDEEEYRDYFGQETGYAGFRLDSTEDVDAGQRSGQLRPSHSRRESMQEYPGISPNFASSGRF